MNEEIKSDLERAMIDAQAPLYRQLQATLYKQVEDWVKDYLNSIPEHKEHRLYTALRTPCPCLKDLQLSLQNSFQDWRYLLTKGTQLLAEFKLEEEENKFVLLKKPRQL